MLYLGSILGLYFPWDFCLSPGMSALTSYPPRFIPPFIATLVAIAAVISVFYCFEKRYIWTTASAYAPKPYGLCNDCQTVFLSRAQKRIWHGVWAFVLLLYTPLVHTCLSLLHCPSMPPVQGGEPTPVSTHTQKSFNSDSIRRSVFCLSTAISVGF